MSKTSPNSDAGAQKSTGSSGFSRRSVLKATGAGLAGAGLSSVAGSASAAGINIVPLARDQNRIVDPQGEEVTLRGVSIADPGEASRDWRGMTSDEVFDMATSHDAFDNTIVRVPMQAEFIAAESKDGPTEPQMPHGDDWGPALPGTYGASYLEDYLDTLIQPLVDAANENGAYIMLDYHRHYPVFHHHEHEEFVTGEEPIPDACYDSITDVWQCTNAEEVDHTVVPDGPDENFPVRPNEGRHPDVCGERGLLWHGEDQIDEVRQTAMDQNVVENFEGLSSTDDLYTEPPELCTAFDAELRQFWETVTEYYGDEECVVFDIYNEPTGPYAGDWGGPERVAGALSDAPAAQQDAHKYEMWGEYAEPYHRMWVERSQPWVDIVEDGTQGQLKTIGNPRWSQYAYWSPYYEYDNVENMCYTSHVYLQENCRPLQETVGAASQVVPIFFSEFGWMDFDLTVPTPWMDGGIDWGEGTHDPLHEGYELDNGEFVQKEGSLSFGEFISRYPVNPICWAFDHTWEPPFFEHGCPGGGEFRGTTGAPGMDTHWYDDGDWLIEEDTPGLFWKEFVNEKAENADDYNPNSGSSRYDGTQGPNNLTEQGDGGYAFPLPGEGDGPAPSGIPENTGNFYGDIVGDCGEDGESMQVEGQTVCDVDGDGSYRDVTGDGSVGQDDVTAFFERQHKEAWQIDAFDFSGNGEVNQFDVVDLFDYTLQ